jgi:hypothetical protein
MPELTVLRTSAAPPMVCMYCGKPATTTQQWREVNRKPGTGGGADLTPVPVGDDPISVVIGLLMLPLVLWQLLTGLVAAIGAVVGLINRPAPPTPAAPPREPTTTLVVVTACDRHRRFRDRFFWAGLGVLAVLAALWVGAVLETRRVMGTEEVGPAVALMVTAIVSTILLPAALATWYVFAGPVIVERVTEGTVVLDRVRRVYFDATGIEPADAT